jgi:succinoglycan biosynthesis protein ExoO
VVELSSVTVVIPAYNAAAFLSRAIMSAVRQTTPAKEIIIVDDGSSDATYEVAAQLAREHEQISVLKFESNRGPAAARNAAIMAARGAWIGMLDADDAWKPGRIAALASIGAERGADFVADNQILFDAISGEETRTGFRAAWRHKDITIADLFLNDRIGVSEFNYGLLKPLVRKQFLMNNNIKYNEKLKYGEDFDLYSEILISGGKAVITSEPYYIYTTRMGDKSRKRSPQSRTSPSFESLIESSDAFIARHEAQVTPELRMAHALRRAQLMRIHLANLARQLRRDGQYGKYAVFVLSHPSLLAWLIRSNVTKLSARLGLRKQS